MNDNTMTEVRERHKKEIEDFQRDCPHTEISDWMPSMWAPEHYGLDVKICNRCYKVMETMKVGGSVSSDNSVSTSYYCIGTSVSTK